ncbi:MAG: class I SAM-dependent methyltransferase [Thermoleophilaceae bacterium]
MSEGEAEAGKLSRRIAEHDWYHTLELAPGVLTPGWFDTRAVPDLIDFPASLEGLRCLDVGTFDGFWAFELERRGAAEVLAIDVLDPKQWDWPAGSGDEVAAALDERKARGAGFELAARRLASRVERRELSVYDLDPGDVGEFDFVYLGSLLLHLRDPIGALMRVRAVCRGRLLLVDAVQGGTRGVPAATLDGVGRPWWWKPNPAGLARMAEAAGFRILGGPRSFRMPAGAGIIGEGAGATSLRHPRRWVRQRRAGDPHAAVHAEPA